jgi:hypothetical protein
MNPMVSPVRAGHYRFVTDTARPNREGYRARIPVSGQCCGRRDITAFFRVAAAAPVPAGGTITEGR